MLCLPLERILKRVKRLSEQMRVKTNDRSADPIQEIETRFSLN